MLNSKHKSKKNKQLILTDELIKIIHFNWLELNRSIFSIILTIKYW